MSGKRLKYSNLLPSKYDVRIFQQLPIYIRKRILKDAKIVNCKNYALLYEIAFSAVKEFEYYQKIYDYYLSVMENEN